MLLTFRPIFWDTKKTTTTSTRPSLILIIIFLGNFELLSVCFRHSLFFIQDDVSTLNLKYCVQTDEQPKLAKSHQIN